MSADVGVSGADVPAGEYLATYYDGDEWVTTVVELDGDGDTQISSADGTGTQSHSSDGITVVVAKGYGQSYGPNETVYIWAGVKNGSTAIPTGDSGVELSINVTGPDGTVDSYTKTTGTNGAVSVSYALDNRSNGQYNVQVNATNYSEGFSTFNAGPIETAIYPGISDKAEVGVQTNVTLLVTSGDTPVSGVTRNVTVTNPDGNQSVVQVTTDADGYATFSFTPTQAGRYRFSSGQAFGSKYVGSSVGSVFVNGQDFSTDITPNGSVAISGEVYAGGLADNTSLVLSVVNTTDSSTVTVEQNISVSTDAYGQYLATWTPDSGETGDYEVRVYDANGNRVAAEPARIDVRERSDSTFTPSPVQVDVEPEGGFDTIAEPGSTVNVTVTVTENGSAVAGTDVQLGSYFGFEMVPEETTVVTTNSTGMATYTLDVPQTAPDGERLEIRAFASVNGSSDTGFGDADIQRYRLEDRRPSFFVQTGGSINYSFVTTDAETGAAVSGVPTTVAGEIGGLQGTLIGTASESTDANGFANYSLSVPDAPGRSLYLGTFSEYESPFGYPTFRVADYPVRVNGVDSFEYNAGETVSFNYTADTTADTSAVVVVWTYDDVDEKVLLAQRAAPGETLSFTVPTTVPDGTDYRVDVKTASSNDDLSQGGEFFRVNATKTDTASRVNVTGTFEDANGNALADDIVVSNGPEVKLDHSNATGAFEIALLPNETYSLTFAQNGSNSVPPRDGVADLYKFEATINVSSDTDLGAVTIPNASVLNVQVVNESGAPVEDALVSIRPDNRTGVASPAPVATTDSNGYLHIDNLSETGIEVTGNVTVLVRPPENSSTYVDDTYSQQLEVTQDTNISVSLNETVSDAVVSGSVQDANGNALANRSVVANGPEFIVNTTNSAGEFGIAQTPDTAYSITFVQANESVSLPRDGVADLYKLEPTVNVSSDTDLGAYTIPNASVLDVRVVNQSGVAVENASVVVYPNNRTGVKSTGWIASTNDNGYFESSEGTTGIEVTGNTTVKVRPPQNATGYENTTYTRLLEVTNDTNVTVTLAELASVTFANQTSSGSQVTVERVYLPRGGFVTIHDSSLLDGKPFSSVRGNSTYLSSGVYTNLTVTLDDPLTESGQVFAMPHRDSDDDQTYDFVATNGSDDGPYFDNQGNPIVDGGEVTVSNATLETSVTDAAPGENATVAFTLTNIGDQDKGFVLNLTNIPENVTVVDQYADGATWSSDRTAWTYQTVNSGESVQPNVTLAVPDNRTEDITFTAVAKTSDGIAAERTVTITPCQTVRQAVDANDNGQIGDFEILDAIEYWRDGTEVPGTCGETIGDFQILDLIELWRDGGSV